MLLSELLSDLQRRYGRFRGGDVLRVVTFKAPESLVEAIDKLARAYSVDRSDVIRSALLQYLAVYGSPYHGCIGGECYVVARIPKSVYGELRLAAAVNNSSVEELASLIIKLFLSRPEEV